MELYDFEAERAVLCAVLLENNNIEYLLDNISVECFKDDYNRAAYTSMVRLYADDKAIDTVALAGEINSAGYDVPQEHINEISESLINKRNFKKYVSIVKNL